MTYTADKGIPAVLTIAGSDSSGGAGIEADLKTFTTHGVYGLTCIAALTAQNTTGVSVIQKTPTPIVKEILKQNFDDFLYGYEKAPLRAVKTGMLTDESIAEFLPYVADLQKQDVKIVIDPVMVATSGSHLFDGKYGEHAELFKSAYLVTPNYKEAQILYEKDIVVSTRQEFKDFVKKLQSKLQCKNLLVKGGHIPWNSVTDTPFEGEINEDSKILLVDILYESETDTITTFESRYITSNNTHGTGCTLASAIASNLAKDVDLKTSISHGIKYVQGGMTGMEKLGHGKYGPLNHMIEKWGLNTDVKTLTGEEPVWFSKTNALKFFTEHEKIRDNWKKYINHPFLKALAEDKLPFERFLYFLKQDYYYLVNYAQVHGLAAAAAPNYQQTHSEALIIGNVVQEINKHKDKLSRKYNIDYERDLNFDKELSPGPACVAYCDYLNSIASEEDYLGIKVALAPCLFGYYEGGLYGDSIRKAHKGPGSVPEECSKVYQEWLDDYKSEMYTAAYFDGEKAFQELFEEADIDRSRVNSLVDIFNKVVTLEIDFWSEVIEGEMNEKT